MKKDLSERFIKAGNKDPLKDLAKELFDEGWTTEQLAKEDHRGIADPVFWNVWNHLKDLELGIRRGIVERIKGMVTK